MFIKISPKIVKFRPLRLFPFLNSQLAISQLEILTLGRIPDEQKRIGLQLGSDSSLIDPKWKENWKIHGTLYKLCLVSLERYTNCGWYRWHAIHISCLITLTLHISRVTNEIYTLWRASRMLIGCLIMLRMIFVAHSESWLVGCYLGVA